MAKSKVAKVKRLVRLLNTAREIADQLELTNGSGGEIGSLIGSIADEIEVELANQKAESEFVRAFMPNKFGEYE